jgi:hypothetical protein
VWTLAQSIWQAALNLHLSLKKTRKQVFLEPMERVVPWVALVQCFTLFWCMKKRLFGPGGVANPRHTTRYRCGLRLASTQSPSLLWVPSSVKHCTIELARIIREPRLD